MVSSTTIATALADAGAGTDTGSVLGTLYDPSRPCVVVVDRGINDFTLDGRIGPALYDIANALVAIYKAQGFYVAIETVLSRSYAWNATLKGYRTDYNALVCANAAGADAIVDGVADSAIGDAAGVPATYHADSLHLTAAGQDRKMVLYQAAQAGSGMSAGAARPLRYATLDVMAENVGGGGSSYGYKQVAADGHAVSAQMLAAGADGWIGYTVGTSEPNGMVIELMPAVATAFTPDHAAVALHGNSAYNGGSYQAWHGEGQITTSTVAPVAAASGVSSRASAVARLRKSWRREGEHSLP